MVDFKVYATRMIRKFNSEQTIIKKYWTRHGSTKYIWTKENLASVMRYVRDEQGKIMAFGTTDN